MPAQKKSIDDLSRKYLKDKQFPWSRLWREKVIQVNGSAATLSAKLTYFLLHPFMLEYGGYLRQDISDVAADLGMRKTPDKLQADIENLVRYGILRKDSEGVVFCPRMAKDYQTSEDIGLESPLSQSTTEEQGAQEDNRREDKTNFSESSSSRTRTIRGRSAPLSPPPASAGGGRPSLNEVCGMQSTQTT